jgi:hypothetical protein
MYRGREIVAGAEIFLFHSDTAGGRGLFAAGVVTSAKRLPRGDALRTTPRFDVHIERTATAKRPFGRREARAYRNLNDDQPQTELVRRLYRQATDKIIGVSAEAAAFLRRCFLDGAPCLAPPEKERVRLWLSLTHGNGTTPARGSATCLTRTPMRSLVGLKSGPRRLIIFLGCARA